MYRTAGLTEDIFDLDWSAPGKDERNEPVVKWANVGSYAGWYALGTRVPSWRNATFWQRALAICAACGNRAYDAVHSVGPGILSVGAVGATMASGLAQSLLHRVLIERPVVYMSNMAPLMLREDGVWPNELALEQGTGRRIVATDDLEYVVRRDKDLAREWVRCTSRMLRNASCDAVQLEWLRTEAKQILSEPLRVAIKWTERDARDSFFWSAEQQALWLVTFALVMHDPDQTERLILSCIDREALTTLRNMRMRVQNQGWSEHLAKRLANALDYVEHELKVRVVEAVA